MCVFFGINRIGKFIIHMYRISEIASETQQGAALIACIGISGGNQNFTRGCFSQNAGISAEAPIAFPLHLQHYMVRTIIFDVISEYGNIYNQCIRTLFENKT